MDSYVKVLRSYDYNHFEFCIPLDEKATVQERNEARKDAERLANEAVRQYKKAKEMARKRDDRQLKIDYFILKITAIQDIPQSERTPEELAMLKQYEDKNWESQFDYPYDYEDDEI